MARLPVTDQETIRTQRKGFCRVVANITDFSKPAIEDVITGISNTNGVFLGGLGEEPSLASEDEILDFNENLYGAQGPIQGMWDIQSTSTSLTATFLKQTPLMYQLLFPDYEEAGTWGDANAAAASLTIGTGAAGVTYTANSSGTAGNSIRVGHVNPGAAGSLSVAVSGNDITVTLAHDGTAVTSTAAQVRDAVNASAGASALVAASLAGDGTGTAVTQALTNLAGGAGTTYGRIITRSGNVTNAAYFSNVCLCFSGQTEDEIGMVWRLNNVTNRSDSKEISPDGDGNISGTEMQLMAHESFEQLSGGERVPPFSVYMPAYMEGAAA